MSLRLLTADEERILRLLLTPDVEDQATFLGQLPFAEVSGNWVEGLPSIDIQLAEGAPKGVTKEGPLPVEAEVSGADGEVSGLILVWVKDGALAALEYAWYSNVPPTEWPDSENVTVRLSGS